MSNVPYIKTQYRNNFIGKDRPIYGNEVIPPGGCFPPDKSRQVLSVKQNGVDVGELYFMEAYSGGVMNSIYFENVAGTTDKYRDFDNYTRNATLSGYTFLGWQGPSALGGKIWLFWDDYSQGYTLMTAGTLGDPEFNPLYWGGFTSAIGIATDVFQADIIDGIAYPQSTGNFGYTLTYNPLSCFLPTPTPSPTGNVLPSATPTPTPTITPTPSITSSSTPTPTPSITPTITPSPTTCNCREYDVYNPDTETADIINWLDCGYVQRQQTLSPLSYLRICACAGSITTRNITTTITDVGPCGITPTPSPTRTPTPTPSSSGYLYLYQGANCADPLDLKVFASNSFIAPSKAIRGALLADCYENTGQVFGVPYDDVVINSYNSCFSCPA